MVPKEPLPRSSLWIMWKHFMACRRVISLFSSPCSRRLMYELTSSSVFFHPGQRSNSSRMCGIKRIDALERGADVVSLER